MIDTILWLDDRGLIEDFYRACGYSGGILPGDRIMAAREETKIIGVVRICREEGFTVIRGMEVAESHRRGGVGTHLLHFAIKQCLTDKVCWGIAYRELEDFYRQGGFLFVQDDDPRIPHHLQERLAKYGRGNPGRCCAIMLR